MINIEQYKDQLDDIKNKILAMKNLSDEEFIKAIADGLMRGNAIMYQIRSEDFNATVEFLESFEIKEDADKSDSTK